MTTTTINPTEVREMLDRYGAGRRTQPYVVWVHVPGGFVAAHSAGPGGYTPMGIADLPTHVYYHGGHTSGSRREVLPIWAVIDGQACWMYPADTNDKSWGLTTDA